MTHTIVHVGHTDIHFCKKSGNSYTVYETLEKLGDSLCQLVEDERYSQCYLRLWEIPRLDRWPDPKFQRMVHAVRSPATVHHVFCVSNCVTCLSLNWTTPSKNWVMLVIILVMVGIGRHRPRSDSTKTVHVEATVADELSASVS